MEENLSGRSPGVLSRLAHIENGNSGPSYGIPKFIHRHLEPKVPSDREITGDGGRVDWQDLTLGQGVNAAVH